MKNSCPGKSLLNRVPCVLCVPTCQMRVNISFLRANVPKTCHFSNWRANVPRGVPIFQLFSKRKNDSIMVNICKFQEYLGNSRKVISRSKEFETKYFVICLFLPCTPQIFLKKHGLYKMIAKVLYEQKYSKT